MHSYPVDLAGHMMPATVGYLQINGELVAVIDESVRNDDGTWTTEVWRSPEAIRKEENE